MARNLVQSPPMPSQSDQKPTVFIVDDDASIRFAMQALMDSVNLEHEIFESGDDFLSKITEQRPGCLVLDIRMPGMDGLQLQQELKTREIDVPIIFLSGHADVPIAVNAVKAGAFDFIEKPFREQHLLDSVKKAVDKDAELRRQGLNRSAVMGRMATLTDREREVLELVLEGMTSKAIAAKLGRSHNTIDQHRAKILEKMQAGNVASLVRMVLDARAG